MHEMNTLRPVSLFALSNSLDLRIGILRSMIRGGILRPVKLQPRIAFMRFDPRAVCAGITEHFGGSHALVSKALAWIERLEKQQASVLSKAVKQEFKTRARKKKNDSTAAAAVQTDSASVSAFE